MVSTESKRPRIGFHASHEQFSPRSLLELAQRAEQAGFDFLFSSDHFNPWGTAQGQSGFSFAWLGAALQATRLPVKMICCPFGRYHPAVVAQAIATLAEMFPQRVDLAIGSGQALNEHITGQPWPPKQHRNELLEESAHIIKALWSGEKVSRRGLVAVEQAYLWSRPEIPPRLFGAAVTDGTAQQVSAWADGLLTTSRPYDESLRIIKLFRSSDRDRRPAVCKIGLGYARSSQHETLRQCHEQWRNACFANHVLTEVRTTEDFDELGRKVRPEDLAPALRISSNLDDHLRWIRDDFRAGFDEVVVHNVGPQQSEFIDDFGKYILPQIR